MYTKNIFQFIFKQRKQDQMEKDGYYNTKEVKTPTEIVILPVLNTIFVH